MYSCEIKHHVFVKNCPSEMTHFSAVVTKYKLTNRQTFVLSSRIGLVQHIRCLAMTLNFISQVKGILDVKVAVCIPYKHCGVYYISP